MRYLQHRNRKQMSAPMQGIVSVLIIIVFIGFVRVVTPYTQGYIFELIAAMNTDSDVAFREIVQQTALIREDYTVLLEDYNNLRGVHSTSTRGRILSHPLNAPRDTLIARFKGAKVDDVIYADAGGRYAIGVVTDVSANTARASLFSKAGVETPVKIGEDRVPVMAVGHGGGEIQIALARDIAVVAGDEVYLSDGESRIGKVESVVALESDPTQLIRLHLSENILTLQFVYHRP